MPKFCQQRAFSRGTLRPLLLLFCLGIHNLVSSLKNGSKMDVMFSTFQDLAFVDPKDATLLGSPLGSNSMVVCVCVGWGTSLPSNLQCHHHPTPLICNPETSSHTPDITSFSSSLLLPWDELLLSVVARITNIDLRLGDPSWLQASLPVSSAGLGLRNAPHIAPSAFLASADGASTQIKQPLPPHLSSSPYSNRETALSTWTLGLPEDIPLSPYSLRGHQKSWDQPRVEQLYLSLLSSCDNDVSRACLLAAASKHSGVWLNAPPVSSLGLRMCTETIHIAVGLRVGAVICHPHSCEFCAREVDQLGYHGLTCRYSQGHLARHNAVNSVIHRSFAAAKIPSRLEHSGLHRSYGKHPNSITTPWSEGKFLVWDATCVDTFCESH